MAVLVAAVGVVAAVFADRREVQVLSPSPTCCLKKDQTSWRRLQISHIREGAREINQIHHVGYEFPGRSPFSRKQLEEIHASLRA